jgi:ABC-type transport system involved in cytochrome bd biosynthesis fused ATPase/permease subunit
MTDQHEDLPLRSLILVPAIITLAVTLLRLGGELLRWSPTFFWAYAFAARIPVVVVMLLAILATLSRRTEKTSAA